MNFDFTPRFGMRSPFGPISKEVRIGRWMTFGCGIIRSRIGMELRGSTTNIPASGIRWLRRSHRRGFWRLSLKSAFLRSDWEECLSLAFRLANRSILTPIQVGMRGSMTSLLFKWRALQSKLSVLKKVNWLLFLGNVIGLITALAIGWLIAQVVIEFRS